MNRFIIVVFLANCNPLLGQDKGEYIFPEKWRGRTVYAPYPLGGSTQYEYSTNSLKGNPKQLKETDYYDLKDTSLKAQGLMHEYDVYKFDRYGNMIAWKRVSPTTSVIESSYKYTVDGLSYHDKLYAGTGSDKPITDLKVVSEKIDTLKYKETRLKNGMEHYSSIITVSEPGRVVKQEKMDQNTVSATIISYFNEGRIIKEDRSTEQKKSIKLYHYSSKWELDSTIQVADGERTKMIFHNNEKGDPVNIETTINGKLVEVQRMKYEYDKRGNWTRRLSFRRGGSVYFSRSDIKFPEYELTVRKIKY
jgi:hypothetical protein